MKRKINRVGTSTLTVSLPSKWANTHGIKPGDEIEVIENDDQLILNINPKHEPKKISYNLTNFAKRAVKWAINIAYKKGYDEVIVHSDSEDTIDFLTYAMSINPGYEIFEQTGNKVVIKNIAKSYDNNFKNLLRRDFLNMKELVNLMLEKIKSNDLKSLIKLERFLEYNDRIATIGERIVNIEISRSNVSSFYYIIFWYHEKIVDRLKYIIHYFADEKNCNTKISKEAIKLFQEVKSLFDSYYEAHYNFDINKVNDMIKSQSAIKTEAQEMLSNKKGKEIVIISYLLEISEKILECLPPTLAINTDKYEIKEK